MKGRVDSTLGRASADSALAQPISLALMQTERALIDRAGIPGRPWYRHLIYAPRPTYAPEVLPGVAEAIDVGDRARVAEQAERLAAALDRASAILKGDQ